jgi:hypothetical protein
LRLAADAKPTIRSARSRWPMIVQDETILTIRRRSTQASFSLCCAVHSTNSLDDRQRYKRAGRGIVVLGLMCLTDARDPTNGGSGLVGSGAMINLHLCTIPNVRHMSLARPIDFQPMIFASDLRVSLERARVWPSGGELEDIVGNGAGVAAIIDLWAEELK